MVPDIHVPADMNVKSYREISSMHEANIWCFCKSILDQKIKQKTDKMTELPSRAASVL